MSYELSDLTAESSQLTAGILNKQMQDFRNLKVWQKAHELALFVYRNTADFPREETFGLKHSMRKTAVDIPAYIAEASGKSNDRDTAASMNASIALTTRLEYYVIMARDLELVPESVFPGWVK